jgi:DNA-binding NarL/FixJ family response regulator
MIVDNAVMRVGIRQAVGTAVEVCAETDDPQLAIRAAEREQPDVCLLGRAVAGEQLRVLRGICRAAPSTAVIVLTDVLDAEDLLECVRSGAVGYADAALDVDKLQRMLRAIERDEAIIPRSMVGELVLELSGAACGGGDLTQREAQIFGMFRRGHSTVEIAERLEIEPVTVRRHIAQVVQKLGVANRSELRGPAPLRLSRRQQPTCRG